MKELVPRTISVEAWAVRAYVDGLTHPSRKPGFYATYAQCIETYNFYEN